MQISVLIEGGGRGSAGAAEREVLDYGPVRWIEDHQASIRTVIGVVQGGVEFTVMDDGMLADRIVGIVPIPRRAAAAERVEEREGSIPVRQTYGAWISI